METGKPKTVRNAHTLLSAVLQSAVVSEHVEKNVAHRVPLPKDDAEEEMDIFSPKERDAFLHGHARPLQAVHHLPVGDRPTYGGSHRNPRARPQPTRADGQRGQGMEVRPQQTGIWDTEVAAVASYHYDPRLGHGRVHGLAKGKAPDELLFPSVRGSRIY